MQYGIKSRPQRELLLSGNRYEYVARKTMRQLNSLQQIMQGMFLEFNFLKHFLFIVSVRNNNLCNR